MIKNLDELMEQFFSHVCQSEQLNEFIHLLLQSGLKRSLKNSRPAHLSKITTVSASFLLLQLCSISAFGATHVTEIGRPPAGTPTEPVKFGFVSIGRQIIADRLTDEAVLRKKGVKAELQRSFNLAIDECKSIEFSQVINLSQPKSQQQLTVKLDGCRADNESILLSGILIESSFLLRNEEGRTFQNGKDYSIVDNGTLLKIHAEGSAANENKLTARYKCWLSRIDTIAMDENYTLKVVKGNGYTSAPEVNTNLEGKIPIANVWVVGGESGIDSGKIWEIRQKRSTKGLYKRPACRASFVSLRQKLESGDKIKIGFLGDSVTGGSSAREKKFAFPQLVEARLRKEFPNATVETAILAMGGKKCADTIPLLPEFLDTQKPDILFVEFVNDLSAGIETLAAPYQQLEDICRQRRIKLCLISPHYPIPLLANAHSWSTIKDNPYFKFLRIMTQGRGTELIDVSSRWQHLEDEGLRPHVLLVNRINHPNNTGHQIYATELLKCFGIAD